MSALRDDNRRLTETVAELRAERRAQDRRVRDLQRQVDLARAQQVTAALGDLPVLPVEVVAPPGSAAAPAPAPIDGSPEARVVGIADDGSEIVYEGDAAAGRVATLEDAPRPAPVARTAARPRRAAAREVAVREAPTHRDGNDGDAESKYRAAVELVKTGQHDDAVTPLRAFITRYARHDYADNAQYWLGESFYARRDYAQALVEFRAVIETYPRGNKVPDALLKVGYCYQSLGQPERARAVLEQVVHLYPKTPPAAIAARQLESR